MSLLPVLSGEEVQGPLPRSIVGGTESKQRFFPFAVLLTGPGNYCSGSVIAPNWVLTAAHCARSNDPPLDRFLITWGESTSDWNDKLRIKPKRFILHPKYDYGDSSTSQYDIALVELATPLPKSAAVSLVIADGSSELTFAPSGTQSIMIGFGRTSITAGSQSKILRYLKSNLYHFSDCPSQFGGDSPNFHSRSICAGSYGKSTGPGDSGGPLVVEYTGEGDAFWLQVGVSQLYTERWGMEEDIATSVFARVSSFADWIQTTTRGAASFGSVTPSVQPLLAPDLDDVLQLRLRLDSIAKRMKTLKDTVQTLQGKKELKRLIDRLERLEDSGSLLQSKETGILNGAPRQL